MQKLKLPNSVYFVVFVAAWLFTIYTGLMGIDFGSHWDERKLMKSVRDSVKAGKVTPGWYNYPSMIFNIVALSSIPEVIDAYHEARSEFANVLESKLKKAEFTLRARTIFLYIVSLTSLWIYLLIVKITNRRAEALLGASIFLSSWQAAYHARWLAPDGILMQFGFLSILLAVSSLKASGRNKYVFLGTAAIAAGLACSSKYYGGIFLVPVLIAGIDAIKRNRGRLSSVILVYGGLGLIFAATFLSTTPGALVETAKFISDIQFEIRHYSNGHPGYTVEPGLQHASLLLVFLSLAAFSKYWFIALLIFLLALLGIFAVAKDRRNNLEVLVLLSVPVLYTLFMTSQKVMFVRSYLLLFPFLAVFSARGVMMLWESKRLQTYRQSRSVLSAIIVLALAVNFTWLYTAAASIQQRKSFDTASSLSAYIQKNPSTIFFLSDRLQGLINDTKTPGLNNITDNPLDANEYLFLSEEYGRILSNRINQYDAIFGPYEVDINYYPSWSGDSRVVQTSIDHAVHQGLILVSGND